MHSYTTGQVQFLRDHVTGRSYGQLTELFNRHFDLNLTEGQIKGTLARHKLRNGRDGRFRPGVVPHNKGTRGVHQGGEATQFKPGQMPWNYRPVGSERINRDGYVEVKIADPKTWKGKHLLVWEAAHGPVPRGHAVIFADGDRKNLALENLLLVSRAKLAVMNKRGLVSSDPELTRVGAAVADIYLKIGERKRNERG